jgi:hypothetical protein
MTGDKDESGMTAKSESPAKNGKGRLQTGDWNQYQLFKKLSGPLIVLRLQAQTNKKWKV